MDKGRYREELRALEESYKPIDEAIVRQSVKSEEVQRAIAKIEKIVAFDNEHGYRVNNCHSLHIRDIKTALTALQAYQLPSAITWTGDNLREVINLIGWNESASSKWTWEEYEQVVKEKGLKIFTPDGSSMAGIGDWIVRDGNDCFVLQAYQPAAIPQTETTSCEKAKTKIEKKYDHYRSYAIQGDCFKYVCSCNDCGQPLWEIEDYNYFKGERGYKPPFCPNCGRRLED